MNEIHALGAGVSMCTGGASAVEGGNWQIFKAMLDDSSADVRLGTEVSHTSGRADKQVIDIKAGDATFQVITNGTINDDFDQIFFANPWHLTPMAKSISENFIRQIPYVYPQAIADTGRYQKYVHLHVTYLTTTSPHPLPAFFGLPVGTTMPTTILTSGETSRSTPSTPPPRFQSITYHGETHPGSGEYVVKIFSLTYLSDRMLSQLFGEIPGWLLRKEWDSYPKLGVIGQYAPVEPMKGFQYLAALEPWVST